MRVQLFKIIVSFNYNFRLSIVLKEKLQLNIKSISSMLLSTISLPEGASLSVHYKRKRFAKERIMKLNLLKL